MIKNDSVFMDFFFRNIDYKSIKNELLPSNSGYVIVQMPLNKEFIYFGAMFLDKNREAKYHIQKEYLTERKLQLLNDYIDRLNFMKSKLQTTPITTDEDMTNLEQSLNEKYCELLEEFETFCTFFTKHLDPIINPLQKEETIESQPQQQQAGGKGGKEPPKQQDKGKKAVPGELAAFISNLSTPTSGIESLVLLIDERLSTLPWEKLQVFSKIPAISRDFSLNIHAKRLKNVGFNAQANNSTGIPKNNIKYMAYEFKPFKSQGAVNYPQVEGIMKRAESKIPGAKFEGVSTSYRIPSLGEWQQQMSNGSMLLYYGNPSLLHLLTPKLLITSADICKAKGFVIFDRIAAKREALETFTSLDPEPEKTLINEQPLKTVKLLTMMGSSFTMINQWPVKPEESLKAMESFLTVAGGDIYLAAALKDYKVNLLY